MFTFRDTKPAKCSLSGFKIFPFSWMRNRSQSGLIFTCHIHFLGVQNTAIVHFLPFKTQKVSILFCKEPYKIVAKNQTKFGGWICGLGAIYLWKNRVNKSHATVPLTLFQDTEAWPLQKPFDLLSASDKYKNTNATAKFWAEKSGCVKEYAKSTLNETSLCI